MAGENYHKVLLQYKREINNFVPSTPKSYRDAFRDDAMLTISQFQPSIENWMVELNNRNLSCFEIIQMLEAYKDEIHLNNLEKIDLSPDLLNSYKNNILKIIAKSVLDCYLSSVFNS